MIATALQGKFIQLTAIRLLPNLMPTEKLFVVWQDLCYAMSGEHVILPSTGPVDHYDWLHALQRQGGAPCQWPPGKQDLLDARCRPRPHCGPLQKHGGSRTPAPLTSAADLPLPWDQQPPGHTIKSSDVTVLRSLGSRTNRRQCRVHWVCSN